MLDAFAGSGAMSREFAIGGRVIANDIQAYSFVLCSALLQKQVMSSAAVAAILSNTQREIREHQLKHDFDHAIQLERQLSRHPTRRILYRYVDALEEIRQLADAQPNVISYFGGLYFSVEQACEIQSFLDFLECLDILDCSYVHAAIISAASYISFTVGNQFAQPMRWLDTSGAPKPQTIQKFSSKQALRIPIFIEKSLKAFNNKKVNSGENISSMGTDINAIEKYNDVIDFIYADPPYGREHYSRYYHVLETIATRKFQPPINPTTMIGSDRFQSEYSIRSRSRGAFKQLFRSAKSYGIPIALSYADHSGGDKVANRVMEIEMIRCIAEDFFDSIDVSLISEENYSQFNSISLSSRRRKNSEYLFILR